MKMVLTLRVEWEVHNLSEYEAVTLEEAVANQLEWIEDGTSWVGDYVEDMQVVSLEGVK